MANRNLKQNQQSSLLQSVSQYALVMKGGGIKGLAYIGAIEILQQQYQFNWFIGTSAGAITAILMGAGYSPSELKDILQNKEFKDFFDAKWYQIPFNLIFHKGMHKADAFTEWLDVLLAKKLNSHTRVKMSDLPNRVTIYASRRGKSVLKFDSLENNDAAAYAARCSMSIPWIFTPQVDNGLYAYDGGIQNNYPVEQLLKDHPGTSFIGLYLGTEIYEPIKLGYTISDLLSITTEASDPDIIEKYRKNTIIIDPRPIKTLDFSLTADEKKFLLLAGQTGALEHINSGGKRTVAIKRERNELKSLIENERKRKRKVRRLLMTLFICCVVIGLGVWWRLTPESPQSPKILASFKFNYTSWDKKLFDASMPGIMVIRRGMDIDLTHEIHINPELVDTSRISPSYHTYEIQAQRVSDDARFVIYEFASQRKLMDVNVVSDHPYAVWFRQDPNPLGKDFSNVWTVVIDVSRHARYIPFSVKFNVIRWNAYQAENKNFVGYLVKADEKEITALVHFPKDYVLNKTQDNPLLKMKQQGPPEREWENFNGERKITISEDRSKFQWTLSNPEKGCAYKAEIDWTKNQTSFTQD